MTKFAKFSLLVVVLTFVGLVASELYSSSRLARAATIRPGDTKAQVERQLGSATMVTPFSPLWRTNAAAALFCDTAETWAYGRQIGFRSQFPWVRFRWLLPFPDDITVEFNISGQVVRVAVPWL